jgi:putative hydrolase of the HAD superfamily
MMVCSPAAILLDLDNTLVDRDSALFAWLERRLRRLGVAHHRELLEGAGRVNAGGTCERLTLCRWLLGRCPELAASAAELAAQIGRELPDEIEPDSSVTAVLERLARRSRLVLVSNGGSSSQRRKLDRAGLKHHFSERIVISEEVGWSKPDARIFRAALQMTSTAPEQALFVGDDPHRDIEGAAGAGLHTAWVARGRDYPRGLIRPDLVIEHLQELPRQLENAS